MAQFPSLVSCSVHGACLVLCLGLFTDSSLSLSSYMRLSYITSLSCILLRSLMAQIPHLFPNSSTRVPGAEKMSASVEVLLRKERHDHFSSYPYGKFTHKYRLKTCGSLHCPLYVRIKLFSTKVPGAEKMSASVEVLFRKERHDHFSSYPYGKFSHKYRLKTCGSLHRKVQTDRKVDRETGT